MLSLLNNTNWFAQYGLLIVLVVALVVLMLISFNRRKKEETARHDLETQIVPGALIKTYFGLYGKVVSVTETTDGKILLVETGAEGKYSYQEIHINAVYALDDKKVVVLDEEGNDVTEAKQAEADKQFEDLEKKLAELESKQEVAAEEQPAEVVEVSEPVEEKPAKKTTTKKSTKKAE